MRSFKTELFKVSFDENDIKKIVNIDHITGASGAGCWRLEQVVNNSIALLTAGKLSKKEAVKIITKASEWML